MFQSYQFSQINPDFTDFQMISISFGSFNRINSVRSIPTIQIAGTKTYILGSFNRINSVRSIPTNELDGTNDDLPLFQSYQFSQINPDANLRSTSLIFSKKFQSYQFSQINPDNSLGELYALLFSCFNRINSVRSIPTIL